MANEAGKGDAPRKMDISRERFGSNWDKAFSTPVYTGKCPRCHENAAKCVCFPTEDGPGQDEASQEVKTNYERRRFNREGV